MKRIDFRKILSAALLTGGVLMAAGAGADAPGRGYGPGYGMGPGMMGGYCAGGDCGTLPGMMGGYGMGPGMMGGYGMGPGMMGGYGMGPGMMGGYGMGPGMMGGYGFDRNLSAEQQRQILKIQNDLRRQHWALMGKMMDEQASMEALYYADKRDDAALSKHYRNLSELRQQMFELSLTARRQIEAVLAETPPAAK